LLLDDPKRYDSSSIARVSWAKRRRSDLAQSSSRPEALGPGNNLRRAQANTRREAFAPGHPFRIGAGGVASGHARSDRPRPRRLCRQLGIRKHFGDKHPDQPGGGLADHGRRRAEANRDNPNGKTAYVASILAKNVSVIDTQTNQVVGSPIGIGKLPIAIAITPDQPPLASFTPSVASSGVPLAFNASASSDPAGAIADYDWSFGDGAQALNGGPSPSHAYSAPGTYLATLTLTDNEGCSTVFIFTGQTASCNGSSLARQTQSVTVLPGGKRKKVFFPRVRVKCPARVKPGGCKFKLQAVTKKRKGKPESAVAKVKVKAGHTAIVSLKPKAAYRAKVASAKKVLVKETVTINGSKRTTFSKLKVVQ